MVIHPPSIVRGHAAAAFLVLVAGVGQGHAQEGCILGEGTRAFQVVTLVGSDRITYISRPRFICSEGVRIQADSAVANSALGFSHFMGNVRYRDRTRELEADEARYFSREARLQASGNLFVRDTVRGSVIENGDLVYLRLASFRDEEEMTVTTGVDRIRPRALLFMRPSADAAAQEDTTGMAMVDPGTDTAAAAVPDSVEAVPPGRAEAPAETEASARDAQEPQTPYRVVGDRLFLRGDQYFRARGSVEIERDSLRAFADEAEYDQELGHILLEGDARVEGSGYDLTGRVIDLDVPGGEIRTVRAIRDGVLTGDRLELTSPEIRLFLVGGVLDRLVATPLRVDPEEMEEEPDSADLARPVAVAEEFRLTADSLDVIAPAEALDRIVAVGGARGESSARDSLNADVLPEVALHDWLEGDTVIAVFVPEEGPVAPDTAQRGYRLDSLMARGDARSLYRLLPSDTVFRAGMDPPAVHYVTGSRILIVMAGGDVDRMEVDGPARGWHLEPEGLRALADSGAVPDTVAVLDTIRTVPDTIRVGAAPTSTDRWNRLLLPAQVGWNRRGGGDPAWVRRRSTGITTRKGSQR
jgi:lipopolysaccharide export system protein LptA